MWMVKLYPAEMRRGEIGLWRQKWEWQYFTITRLTVVKLYHIRDGINIVVFIVVKWWSFTLAKVRVVKLYPCKGRSDEASPSMFRSDETLLLPRCKCWGCIKAKVKVVTLFYPRLFKSDEALSLPKFEWLGSILVRVRVVRLYSSRATSYKPFSWASFEGLHDFYLGQVGIVKLYHGFILLHL